MPVRLRVRSEKSAAILSTPLRWYTLHCVTRGLENITPWRAHAPGWQLARQDTPSTASPAAKQEPEPRPPQGRLAGSRRTAIPRLDGYHPVSVSRFFVDRKSKRLNSSH